MNSIPGFNLYGGSSIHTGQTSDIKRGPAPHNAATPVGDMLRGLRASWGSNAKYCLDANGLTVFKVDTDPITGRKAQFGLNMKDGVMWTKSIDNNGKVGDIRILGKVAEPRRDGDKITTTFAGIPNSLLPSGTFVHDTKTGKVEYFANNTNGSGDQVTVGNTNTPFEYAFNAESIG